MGEIEYEVFVDTKSKRVYRIYDAKNFEAAILAGEISDKKGRAEILINDRAMSSYNVYIDRRCITKAGCVVTLAGLIKGHDLDSIKIRYEEKRHRGFIRPEDISAQEKPGSETFGTAG